MLYAIAMGQIIIKVPVVAEAVLNEDDDDNELTMMRVLRTDNYEAADDWPRPPTRRYHDTNTTVSALHGNHC